MFETAITNLPPGTGFLLPETSAQKASQREDPRAETKNRDHQTREMAEKSAGRRQRTSGLPDDQTISESVRTSHSRQFSDMTGKFGAVTERQ